MSAAHSSRPLTAGLLALAVTGACAFALTACAGSGSPAASTSSAAAAAEPQAITAAKVGDATLVTGDAQLSGQPVARTGGTVAKLANGCLGLTSINGKSTFVVFPGGTIATGETSIDAPGYGTLEIGKDATLAGALFASDAVPQSVTGVPAGCVAQTDFVFFASRDS